MRDWTPGTWWRAPLSERRYAYYLCMRQCYEMPAKEALTHVRANFPAVENLIDDMRVAILRGIMKCQGRS